MVSLMSWHQMSLLRCSFCLCFSASTLHSSCFIPLMSQNFLLRLSGVHCVCLGSIVSVWGPLCLSGSHYLWQALLHTSYWNRWGCIFHGHGDGVGVSPPSDSLHPTSPGITSGLQWLPPYLSCHGALTSQTADSEPMKMTQETGREVVRFSELKSKLSRCLLG